MVLKRIATFFLDVLEVVVFAVAIFLFIYLLILQPHKIKGASMEPNFPDGELLLTDKLSYRFNEPKRGDVIVFKAPGQLGEEFIKRIIGIPGDEISIKEAIIYINGKPLEEEYISNLLKTSPGSFIGEGETVVVPENHYFVLGDNRPFSSDSRSWGFVSKEMITGKAWLIYWPPSKSGIIDPVEYNF